MRRACHIAVLAALALLTGAGGASAGTYDVALTACPAGKPSPFALSADPGLEAVVNCEHGSDHIVAHGGETAPVPVKSAATMTLHAPEGTTVRGIDWIVGLERADCGWSVLLMAGDVPLRGASAGEDCTFAGEVDRFADGMPTATRAISLGVACETPGGCPAAPPSPDIWTPWSSAAVFYGGSVTFEDTVQPKVQVAGLGPPGGRWVRGVQPFRYEAYDGSGIREMTLVLPGGRERHPAPCEFNHPTPCPQGPAELPLDTRRMADGVHSLTAEVLDAASNASSGTALAYVDNTAPAPVRTSVDGGPGWRRSNGFTVGWESASEAYAPIVRAHYRLCRVGTTECVSGSRSGLGIDRLRDVPVPGAGEWALELWREDEAGNVDHRLASAPVHLRLDDAPPSLTLEPRRSEDPRRVSATATDRLSGVAGGEIQLRPARGRTWQTVPTRLDGGRLSAEIDDDRLPAGTYELRAVARDHAGNEGATHVLPDGSAALVQLPLRARARLTAGVAVKRGKRTRLRSRAAARFDSTVRLAGRLTNELGRPVPRARLYVTAQARGGREKPAGAVTTNRRGEFGYRLRARASGVVRVRYEGSRLLGSTRREVSLRVPAASRLTVNRSRVLNGDEVIFKGRLRGRPFPRPGKIIHLQAHYGREGWSNFGRPVRADRRGRWRIPYRFENTRGLVRYRFRILVPREADYPYETGASNTVRVTVRGR